MTVDIQRFERHVDDVKNAHELMRRALNQYKEGEEPNYMMLSEARFYLENAHDAVRDACR